MFSGDFHKNIANANIFSWCCGSVLWHISVQVIYFQSTRHHFSTFKVLRAYDENNEFRLNPTVSSSARTIYCWVNSCNLDMSTLVLVVVSAFMCPGLFQQFLIYCQGRAAQCAAPCQQLSVFVRSTALEQLGSNRLRRRTTFQVARGETSFCHCGTNRTGGP